MKRSKNESFDYEIYFMRKLWVHFQPGADPIADEFFNFPQERPKYLMGYYSISSEKELGKMGALIFIAQFGQDKEMRKLLNKGSLNDQLIPRNIKVTKNPDPGHF